MIMLISEDNIIDKTQRYLLKTGYGLYSQRCLILKTNVINQLMFVKPKVTNMYLLM